MRSTCRVIRIDLVRNVEVRRRIDVKRDIADQAERSVLRWFGYMKNMDERLVEKDN